MTCVISAFSWLYTPFDRAIRHYSRKDLNRLTAPKLEVERVFFLDSLGMFLSISNRLLLRAKAPTTYQILWDQKVVPISSYVDRIFGSIAGRSIVIVWKKRLLADATEPL